MKLHHRSLILIIFITGFLAGCSEDNNPADSNNSNSDIAIIGDWDSQPPYIDNISSPHITNVTNQEIVMDWDNQNSGDVKSEVKQFDNNSNLAVMQIKEHPDQPQQVGLFTKLVWTFTAADTLSIDFYGLKESEAEALGDTEVAFGTWHYVKM
ncbi:MAG: hypothetical protein P9X24_11255 [Candidatus Hatepunaea meridiana]|nr:hypothetical protein [Candidatus Hatepunaea meridiana]